MGLKAWISVALLTLAGIGALAIIVFNINYRGHYIYCGPVADGCLTAEAFGRFAIPFIFFFVKHTIVLFGVWFVGSMMWRIAKNIRGHHGRVGPSDQKTLHRVE